MIANTKRQNEILKFIRSCIEMHGTPPTRREIALEFGFDSANAAQCHLKAMQAKGLIKLTPRVNRGIRLVG